MFRWFRKKQGMANGAMCTWHAVLLFFLLSLVLSRNLEWMVQSGEQRASQEVETKQRRSSWLIFSKLSMTRKRMHMLLLAQQHPANILCRFFLLKDRWLEYNLRVVSCLSIIPKLLSLIYIVALQRSKLSSRNLNAVRTIASPPGAGRVRFATNRQVVCAVGSVPCQNRMATCDALFWLHLGEDIFISGALSVYSWLFITLQTGYLTSDPFFLGCFGQVVSIPTSHLQMLRLRRRTAQSDLCNSSEPSYLQEGPGNCRWSSLSP